MKFQILDLCSHEGSIIFCSKVFAATDYPALTVDARHFLNLGSNYRISDNANPSGPNS